VTAIEIPTPDPRALDDDTRPFAEAISAQYALKREIGRGGMGVVYLARDRRLDRLVAIKTLPPTLAKDATVRERFLRETRTAGAMSHPNIVPIHRADEAEGHAYFVMSYVAGESLAAHIRAHGRLAPRAVAGYLRDIAAALAHAHARGIIHRDIKAENILVERDTDRALVTDFGIARIAESTPLTVTGQLLGTVHYVSPEQVAGGAVDARSDLYSLGVVGFVALTGGFPFDDPVASAVLVAHVTKPAPPVGAVRRDIPAVLGTIIDRCLVKDPSHRFADADELVAALDHAIAEFERPGGAVVPAASARAPRVGDTEAHAVWKRAAELQALTGVQPRPEPVPGERDPKRDRRDGLDVEAVRAAALEAGIDEPYVEHALIEQGLKPGRKLAPKERAVPAPLIEGRPRARIFPLEAVHEISVKGEIPARDVERLVNLLRDETGAIGHTVTKTRELSWWTGRLGTRLDISVVPLDGRTAIRVEKRLWRTAALVVAGSIGTVGFFTGLSTGAALLELFGDPGEGVAVIGGLTMAASTSLFTARRVMRWLRERSTARLRRLGEALARKVRETAE